MRKVAVTVVVYLEVPTGGLPSGIRFTEKMIQDHYNRIEKAKEDQPYPGPSIIGYDTAEAVLLRRDFKYPKGDVLNG